MSPDMSSVKGKSFDMVLSSLGNEVDVSGAEAISFAMSGEVRNMASSFKNFFPDLPGKTVKIGDTWPAAASIEEKTGSMDVKIDFQYLHTLDGIELIDGVECARVSSQVTGTISGSGNQMGQDLTFSGTSKGKGSLVLRDQGRDLRQDGLRVGDRDIDRRPRRRHDHPHDADDQERGQADRQAVSARAGRPNPTSGGGPSSARPRFFCPAKSPIMTPHPG